MRTAFPVLVLSLAGVIAAAFFVAAIAQAGQSPNSPFTLLSTSSAPLGLMLAKGGGHHGGGHMHSMHHGHHGHHGHHFHHRFRRGFYGDWYGSAGYGGGDCWEWNGYKYVWVCPNYDTY